MTRMITAMAATITVVLWMVANASAAEIPQEVLDWLKFSQGTWELTVKGDANSQTQPGLDTAELAADGAVLITKGKVIGTGESFVAVQAWEPAKKKLVVNWYSARGTHARSELDVTAAEVKGAIVGTNDDGATFTGTESIKKIDDNTMETTMEGKLGGNSMAFTLVAKRKK